MPANAVQVGPRSLWLWDFAPVTERTLMEHPELALHYLTYELELRKFFALIYKFRKPIAMISPRIDCLWHSLITFTPLYRAFCQEVFGYYLDHVPRTATTPISETAVWDFFTQYESTFGDVPKPWFDGLSQTLIEAIRNHHVPKELLWSGWIPDLTWTTAGARLLDGSSL